MDWKRRLAELLIAGGTLAAGCNNPNGYPCGNANSDPCICGRPESNSADKALCDSERACQADGGVWSTAAAADGGVATVCEHHAPDGGETGGATDGNSDHQ